METIIIGGVTLTKTAMLGIKQSYAKAEGGVFQQRMADGGLIIQSVWDAPGKIKTDISASGWDLPGLDAVDFDSAVTISCIEPRVITSASTSVAIPRSYRTDSGHTPFAHAVVSGALVETPVSVVSGTATITAVTGASVYRLSYYPILSVKATYNDSRDASQRRFAWSISAEEI